MFSSGVDHFIATRPEHEVHHVKNRIKDFQDSSYKEYDEQKRKEAMVEKKIQRIDSLDFSQMKAKMCLPIEDEGKGWTAEEANTAEMWYKRFLKLIVLSGQRICPTHLIDDFWHSHILDTMRYATDCQETLGFFLHHYPYFGLRGKEDAQALSDCAISTSSLFLKYFGESPFIGKRTKCAARPPCEAQATKCAPQCGGTGGPRNCFGT